jgi:hypothetical protein
MLPLRQFGTQVSKTANKALSLEVSYISEDHAGTTVQAEQEDRGRPEFGKNEGGEVIVDAMDGVERRAGGREVEHESGNGNGNGNEKDLQEKGYVVIDLTDIDSEDDGDEYVPSDDENGF